MRMLSHPKGIRLCTECGTRTSEVISFTRATSYNPPTPRAGATAHNYDTLFCGNGPWPAPFFDSRPPLAGQPTDRRRLFRFRIKPAHSDMSFL